MASISTKPFGVKLAHSSSRTSNLLLGASRVDACCLCSVIWALQQSAKVLASASVRQRKAWHCNFFLCRTTKTNSGSLTCAPAALARMAQQNVSFLVLKSSVDSFEFRSSKWMPAELMESQQARLWALVTFRRRWTGSFRPSMDVVSWTGVEPKSVTDKRLQLFCILAGMLLVIVCCTARQVSLYSPKLEIVWHCLKLSGQTPADMSAHLHTKLLLLILSFPF